MKILKRIGHICLWIFVIFCIAMAFHKPVDTNEVTSSNEEVLSQDEKVLPEVPSQTNALMEVHFIDVGQGDATLIKCGEEAMLIDAGDNSKGTALQNYLKQQGIDSLDYVIATHPDADHIGGMDVIIYKFDCGKIFMPDVEKDTEAYQELLDAMENKRYQKTVPKVGDTYTLGSASFQIISPALTYSETNNNSIVIRLSHGENSFLFTGDAEVQAQQEMTYGGLEIKSDVMKIPHHGGISSYQKWFYSEVKPAYAVISCGKDNSYGHPHKEVLDALKELGVSVFRTDEQGSIIATSDGTRIAWNTSPSITWKEGAVREKANESIVGAAAAVQETVSDVNKETQITEETKQQPVVVPQGCYVVNGKNGKIHIVGQCPATGNGKGAMKEPQYYNTYEEAETYSIQVAPNQEKRKCGNCW